MIDKVMEVEPGKHAIAVKNVSGNDIFFLGHFPEKAIMPGAVIIEAMAQTAIILFAIEKKKKRWRQKTDLLLRLSQSTVFTSCGSGRPIENKGN